jgi:ribosomal protein S18 acetylase RimI-like enzyme
VWRTGATRGVEEWQRLLARVDRAFGNVVERHARDVRLLLATASAWETYDDAGTLVGVALAIPDEECLVRVASDHPARRTLMASGIRLVEEHLRRGTPLWVPSIDAVAEQVAESQGMALSYRDLQMRIDTASARHTAPPESIRLRHFDASPAALREVHKLVCRAWGVEDHWPEFLCRFGTSARERYLWVLLESPQSELLATCFGDIQNLGDGTFGVVRHLDVTPSARRRGLGAWALNELVARFAEVGQPQAQLGVHDDNQSAAPALYSALGWRVVSSQGRWIQVSV